MKNLLAVLGPRVIKVTGTSFHRCSLKKAVLKICSKIIGEHPCRSAISIKLQSEFAATPFPKNISEGFVLK